METLAVFHILKNGGTTIVDRYKHNDDFVYQRIRNELVYHYQQPNQITIHIDDMTVLPPVVFGHGVSFDWNQLTNDVTYATILRHPIDRIISAFNYFKLEMHTVHGATTGIDFRTWFINKGRLLPTPVFYQLQAFTDMPECCVYIEYGLKINDNLLEDLYDQAITNINKLDHVWFTEDDYVTAFDNIAREYKLIPSDGVIHTHDTRSDLAYLGVDYIEYDQLSASDVDLIDEHMKKDIQFYDYCRNKFK